MFIGKSISKTAGPGNIYIERNRNREVGKSHKRLLE